MNLRLCLHVEISSLRLFSVAMWGLVNRKNFSVVQRLQRFVRFVQEGGSVSRVNIGRLITTSVTSRHTSMFFKMAGNFLVRYFYKR